MTSDNRNEKKTRARVGRCLDRGKDKEYGGIGAMKEPLSEGEFEAAQPWL
jgi:hypothetical protein